MMGKTHAVHGATAGALVGLLASTTPLGICCVAAGAVAALGPDVDHPNSPAGKALPPVCSAVRGLSWTLGLPAHRGISHTLLAAVVVGAAVCLVLPWVVGLAVAAGWAAAILGDWTTRTSTPYWLYPLFGPDPHSDRVPRVRYRFLRIYTGGRVEKYVVMPASVVTLAFALGALVVI